MEAVVTPIEVVCLLGAIWLAWRFIKHAVVFAFDVVDQKPVVGRFIWMLLLASGIDALLHGAGVFR
jgi:hypothetical protein